MKTDILLKVKIFPTILLTFLFIKYLKIFIWYFIKYGKYKKKQKDKKTKTKTIQGQ